DRIALSHFVGRRHRRFRFSSARTGPTFDRFPSAGAVFQKSAAAAETENRAGKNRQQRLDRNERRHFERRDNWRQLSRRRRRRRDQKHSTKHDCGRQSGGRGEEVRLKRPGPSMKRKRIVVMGFMGGMPIAGVVWQHIHYIVGLQRLGHEVYYVEDSARIPYNAEIFDTSNDFSYATKLLARLANEFDFKNRWSFCARYLPELRTVGLPLRKIRQLYKSAD